MNLTNKSILSSFDLFYLFERIESRFSLEEKYLTV